MPSRVQQAAIVMLSVHLDGQSADIAQKPRGRRSRADERAAAAVRLEGPSDNQRLAALGFDALFREKAVDRMARRQLDLRRHRRAVHPAADQPGIRPCTERQSERIEQDRFARARFARQHAKPGMEFQVEALDEHDVADCELP